MPLAPRENVVYDRLMVETNPDDGYMGPQLDTYSIQSCLLLLMNHAPTGYSLKVLE